MKKETYTPGQALPKIKSYCAYQERCHGEVRDKLYEFGLHSNEVESTIAKLVEENYLNEQRYAEVFAGGKFRLKHWGKIKIRYELKQRSVSEPCIRQALGLIPPGDYDKILEKLTEQKWRTLAREKNLFIKKRKTLNYLLQKGFEADLCNAGINKIAAT